MAGEVHYGVLYPDNGYVADFGPDQDRARDEVRQLTCKRAGVVLVRRRVSVWSRVK